MATRDLTIDWAEDYARKIVSPEGAAATFESGDHLWIPPGHPEGYLEAFATIYVGATEAIRRHIDGNPMKTEEYEFPTVYDGVRGMQFIYRTVESCENGSVWVSM